MDQTKRDGKIYFDGKTWFDTKEYTKRARLAAKQCKKKRCSKHEFGPGSSYMRTFRGGRKSYLATDFTCKKCGKTKTINDDTGKWVK